MAAAQLAALQNLQHSIQFNRNHHHQIMLSHMQQRKESEEQSERDEGRMSFDEGLFFLW